MTRRRTGRRRLTECAARGTGNPGRLCRWCFMGLLKADSESNRVKGRQTKIVLFTALNRMVRGQTCASERTVA
jgi:hypothetical protein